MTEFNEYESWIYFLKNIWDQKLQTKKFYYYINDIILFNKGIPYRWLYTNGEGVIAKRKDDQLMPSTILRLFKIKSKFNNEQSKIAIIWFLDSYTNKLTKLLADSYELENILKSNSREIVSMQPNAIGDVLNGQF